MIFNDEKKEILKVEAYYIIRKNSSDTYISITSKEGQSIDFTFKDEEINPQLLEMNKPVSIIPHIFQDVNVIINNSHYFFDIDKDKDIVELTRLDDNLFRINVFINEPFIINSPISKKEIFKNMKIDTNFSFKYED